MALVATFLLRAIITGVSLWLGLDIPFYRFSAAILIPLFCLYINRDDILAGVRGRCRFELLDTIICCYFADWLSASSQGLTGMHLNEWLLHLFY